MMMLAYLVRTEIGRHDLFAKGGGGCHGNE